VVEVQGDLVSLVAAHAGGVACCELVGTEDGLGHGVGDGGERGRGDGEEGAHLVGVDGLDLAGCLWDVCWGVLVRCEK